MDPGHPDPELDSLATVFDVARIGICVIDEAGLFVRANPAFCALVDYRAEELVGHPYDMCAPLSIVEVKDRVSLAADSAASQGSRFSVRLPAPTSIANA